MLLLISLMLLAVFIPSKIDNEDINKLLYFNEDLYETEEKEEPNKESKNDEEPVKNEEVDDIEQDLTKYVDDDDFIEEEAKRVVDSINEQI